MEKRYLRAKEVVARYDGTIKLQTLANWRSQKSGPPYIKLGGYVMYPVDELEAWEAQRTIKPLSKD